MSKFDKSMEDIFDIEPTKITSLIVQRETLSETLSSNTSLDLTKDLSDAYEQTKDNLQELIDNGKEALEDVLRIAKESENPKAFEVYSAMLKNIVGANKELLAVQKQMRDMDKNAKNSGGTTIDKAIFVGSTSELAKLIKGNK